MDVFERLQELAELREQIYQKDNELSKAIFNQFVGLPYELKEIEVDYIENSQNSHIIKVYYPILNVPKHFKKEAEKFYRLCDPYKKIVAHEYMLVNDKGQKVEILETVEFKRLVINPEGKAEKKRPLYYIPFGKIDFSIKMSEKTSMLNRRINNELLIKEIENSESVQTFFIM